MQYKVKKKTEGFTDNEPFVKREANDKFKEICDLLPKNVVKISPKNLNLPSPDENGSTFEENSKIKALYLE